MELSKSIFERFGSEFGKDLKQYNIKQLESILEYGSPHAIDQVQYSDDRNFLTDYKGRVFQPTAVLNDEDFNAWRDSHLLSKIKRDRHTYYRMMGVLDTKDAEDLKADKIRTILAAVDDQYKKIVTTILNKDLDTLIKLTLDKYEVNVRKYVAAMLRNRGADLGIHLSLSEACDLVAADQKGLMQVLKELQEAEVYTQADILMNTDALVTSARNIIYTMLNHEIITNTIARNAREVLRVAAEELRSELNRMRYQKDLILVLMILNRYTEIKAQSVIKPLINTYILEDESEAISAYQVFCRLRRDRPDFISIDFSNAKEKDKTIGSEADTSEEHEIKLENQSTTRLSDKPKNQGLNNLMKTEQFNQLMKECYGIDVKINESIRYPMTIPSSSIVVGMQGELIRSYLKIISENSDDKITWFTRLKPQEILNTARHLRMDKYALDEVDKSILKNVEFKQPGDDLLDLIDYLEAENSSHLILVDDISYILNNPNHYESYLDYTLKEALQAVTTRTICGTTKFSSFLKHELRERLLQYRKLWEIDQKREELTLEELFPHHPVLKDQVKYFLDEYLNNPRIILGCPLSKAVTYDYVAKKPVYYRNWVDKFLARREQIILANLPVATLLVADQSKPWALKSVSMNGSNLEVM